MSCTLTPRDVSWNRRSVRRGRSASDTPDTTGGLPATAPLQGEGLRRKPPSGRALPRAAAGAWEGAEREGEPARQPGRPRRQSGRAEVPAADLPRQGEVRLHRPALQHGQRGLGLQRQRELAPHAGLAGPRGGPGRPDPPRQVVLHDAAPPEAPARAAPRGRGDLRVHRRQRGPPPAEPDGRGVRGGELRGDRHLGEGVCAQEQREVPLGEPRFRGGVREEEGVFPEEPASADEGGRRTVSESG